MGKTAVLLGMTGMGNKALEVLIHHPLVRLEAVFAPAQKAGGFPYYPCAHFAGEARIAGVRVFEGWDLRGTDARDALEGLMPDLVVVAGFDQILPAEIVSLPRIGTVNLHPSLLPKYRGPTPTFWALWNRESTTGVTSHFIEDERIDSGRIIHQEVLSIGPDETDGTLRQKLADLAARTLEESIAKVLSAGRESFPLQDEREASYYPMRGKGASVVDLSLPWEEIQAHIRALTPFPGAKVAWGGRIVPVAGVHLVGSQGIPSECREGRDEICLPAEEPRMVIRINGGGAASD